MNVGRCGCSIERSTHDLRICDVKRLFCSCENFGISSNFSPSKTRAVLSTDIDIAAGVAGAPFQDGRKDHLRRFLKKVIEEIKKLSPGNSL